MKITPEQLRDALNAVYLSGLYMGAHKSTAKFADQLVFKDMISWFDLQSENHSALSDDILSLAMDAEEYEVLTMALGPEPLYEAKLEDFDKILSLEMTPEGNEDLVNDEGQPVFRGTY